MIQLCYTVALTSCGRFDLLEKTLASLIPCLEPLPEKILVIEDSGNREVEDVLNRFRNESGLRIEAIVNSESIGQIHSIDRLYSRIETEWVFHCEDDWEFIGSGFIDESYLLMSKYDSCSTVTLWGRQPAATSTNADVVSGIPYFVWGHHHYAGFTFQPGLRRMRDYRIVGPYALLSRKMDEKRVSHAYKNLGYRMLMLGRPYMRHLGQERHVRDPVREKSRIHKQMRSAMIPLDRMKFLLNPEADPHVHVRRRWETARPSMKNWVDWDSVGNLGLSRTVP